MATPENLKEAFAGESMANRKYLAFAQKAESDGFPQVARLFRAIAEAETIHAHNHFRAMGGIKSTADNLKTAMDGESYEFKSMYPPFLAAAEKEGQAAAARGFKYALEVEKIHYELYLKALESVQAGKDLAPAPLYICPVCGHTVVGEPPDRCPICGVPKAKYQEIR